MATATEFVGELADHLNSHNSQEVVEKFVEEINSQHRTLQANVIRAMIEMLTAYGKTAREEKLIDARNEGAVEACEKIAELDLHIPYI